MKCKDKQLKYACQYQTMSAKEWRCFLGGKEIQFRWSRWLSEVLACKKFSGRELLNKAKWRGGSLTISEAFLSSGKLEVQFVSGWQKAADFVKMLNNLPLAQEGHRLCGEEWIFQQDNVAIHNASITKKYLLEQKIRLLDHLVCSLDQQKIYGDWLLQKFMNEVKSTQQFLNSKMHS